MKKAFTLIELLAIIIVLAIIALIATPIVLDIIEDSKKSAAKSSASMILNSANLHYAEQFMKTNNNFKGYECSIENKQGCNELSIDGEKPDKAIITINEKGRVNGKVVFGEYTYYICDNKVSETESSNCSFIDYSLIYEIDENGVITGLKDNGEATNYIKGKEITIPESIDGIKVTEIKENAFSSLDITSVKILSTSNITIGQNAFPSTIEKLEVKSCVSGLYSQYEGILESMDSDCGNSPVVPEYAVTEVTEAGLNQVITIDFSFTNSEYGIKDIDLQISDIVIDNNIAEVTEVIKTEIENGYKYTVSVKASSQGTFKVVIPENKVFSNTGAGNEEVKSKEITVKKAAICKRATTLHTESCSRNDLSGYYCRGAGYSYGVTMTYGSLGTSGTLASGDAFDCDVDGDGNYGECDEATGKCAERFYYVSDLYNTTSQTFDSNYAVLIYYSNTTEGVASTSTSVVSYDNTNYNGPRKAKVNLPTTTQWSNVSLSNTSRAILTEIGTTSTSGGTLPTAFSYEGYAARLITAQELNEACGITIGSSIKGELDNCNYLMENTDYSLKGRSLSGFWLETPTASSSSNVWYTNASERSLKNTYAFDVPQRGWGVRPVIEVLKSDIEY